MLSNPWIRKALEVLAALAVMSFFSRMPILGRLVTLLCGTAAAGIWMLRYNRPVMHRLYQNPNGAKAIGLLCKISREPVPNDPGGGTPAFAPPRPEPAWRQSAPSPAPAMSPGWSSTRPATNYSQPAAAAPPPAPAGSAACSRVALSADHQFFAAARTLKESIRGCDVFLVQPTCPPVNDHLMELLVYMDCMRRASARRLR